jgi:hypothetical protein
MAGPVSAHVVSALRWCPKPLGWMAEEAETVEELREALA